MSKDYEYDEKGALNLSKIGKILIDGKRVEAVDVKTTLPSVKDSSGPNTRRVSLESLKNSSSLIQP